MHNDTDERDNVVQENNDDESVESDNMLQENNMQVAAQSLKDNIDQVENGYASNEYVELGDLHPNKFEYDGWVNLTYAKNITSKFNRFTTPTAIEDLKVEDIFESKLKLLQAITEWTIKREVSLHLQRPTNLLHSNLCFH